MARAEVLTSRDMAIIRRIAKGQVLSLEQARNLFWCKGAEGSATVLANISTVRYRLNQLVGASYLVSGFTSARQSGEQVFGLSQAGLMLLTPLERERAVVGLPGANEMRQQLDAQDAWAALELHVKQSGQGVLLDWRGERELRSHFYRELRRLEREKGRKLTDKELSELDDIPDAEALVELTINSSAGSGRLVKVPIEIDGNYQGEYLKAKIEAMKALAAKCGQQVVWATSAGPGRIARLRKDMLDAGAASSIVVLPIKPKALGAIAKDE